jgi:hypothetical protein
MKRCLAIILALLLSIYLLGGCNKEIKGPERVNLPPTVDFVNIPVEGAKFSSDTMIYWYGSDVDGFIKYFKYAVVESTVVMSKASDPIEFITNYADSIAWVTLEVTLENPRTKEKIKMSADIRDPVRKFIASYVFLYAVDNLNARSWPPVYRMFTKNNHFPDTRIGVNEIFSPYINAKAGSTFMEGITPSFTGSDKIDYPRNPPPFNFQWRLFGPYDSLEMVAIEENYVESVFVDIYGDFYYKGDHYFTVNKIDTIITPPADTVIDTIFNDILIDTLKTGNAYGTWNRIFYYDSLSADLNRPVDSSHNPLTGELTWISDTKINIYDVYRNQEIAPSADTTRLQYFVLWCKSQDDSKVEDPVPAFSWISVIEPKFEREVIIIDVTNYGLWTGGNLNWPKMPNIYWGWVNQSITPSDWPTTVKSVYGRLINNWKPGSFDTANILPSVTISTKAVTGAETSELLDYAKYKCTQDYFAVGAIGSSPVLASLGVCAFSLRDILKHKVILFVKDNACQDASMNFDGSLEGKFIADGISAGMSAWAMVRNPFGGTYNEGAGLYNVPSLYASIFGVQLLNRTAWGGFVTYHPAIRTDWDRTYGGPGQIRIEDFVGANSLISSLPDLRIDTTLLEDRYIWIGGVYELFHHPFRWPSDHKIILGALPEVGYAQKFPGAASQALYLYESKNKGKKPVYPVVYSYSSDGVDSLRIGHVSEYQGTIVGLRYETPLYRSAHFSFTLLPFEETAAQEVVNSVMDWLSVQPYLTTGKLSSAPKSSFNVESWKSMKRELDELANRGMLGNIIPKRY